MSFRAPAARVGHAALALVALTAAARATASFAQDVAPRPALELLGERALENDTFWPVFEPAEKLLADGDRAWLASGAGSSVLQRDAAFDAWHAALAASSCGDAVRAAIALDSAHPAGTLADPGALRARSLTGVELAVDERLALAGDPARRAWSERFGELAARALAASARDPRTWRAVEREHPHTGAAARAALACADELFERGDSAAARRWLVRARAHAARAESGVEALTAACARRATLYSADASADFGAKSGWNSSADGARATTWLDGATALEPFARIALAPPGERAETSVRTLERTRVLAGACSAGAGALWVQTPELVLRVADGRETARVELAPLCARHGLPLAPAFADRACDWPLLPASDGTRVLLVLGRSSSAADNALVCLAEGELVWAWSRAGRTPVADTGGAAASWFGPGRIEFQPGPLVLGATVLAQVRFWPATGGVADGPADDPDSNPLADGAGWSAPLEAGRVESWLCAFEASTGALLWSRFLARGALTESAEDRANLGLRVVPSPAAPLAVGAAGVAVPSALGTLSLVDPLDGRLVWTLRTARARRGEPSNPRAAPRFVDETSEGETRDGETLVWRPEDGPYLVALGPLGGAEWSLARARLATRPLAPAGAWLGGGLERRVCLHPAGAGWEELADGAEPVRSLAPGRRDRPLALGRATPRRVLAVSETGLWLLDRTRELAVLDRRPLAAGEAGPVWLADGWVAVLGEAQLTCFRALAEPREKH